MLPVEFAAQRAARLEQADEDLRPIVAEALARYAAGTDGWDADVIDAAAQLWIEHFAAEAPGASYQRSIATFRARLAESLAMTSQPEGEVESAQVDRVAYWLSTYAVNAGTTAGAYRRGIRYKRWTTMHDDLVRDIHAPLDGQVAPIGGTFDVAGAKLGYPGEPVGPPEGWINCRCLAMPAARTGETMSVRTHTIGPDEALEIDNPNIVVSDDAFAVADPEDIAVEPADETELPESDEPEDEDEELITEIPVHGVAAIEGRPTGDGRLLKRDSASFGALPQPLGYEFESSHGGSNSRVAFIGRIDEYWKVEVDDIVEIRWRGVVHPDKPYASEALTGIIDGSRGGLSIITDAMALDVAATQAEYDSAAEGTTPAQHLSELRIRRFDMVPTGALQEAYIALGHEFEDELTDEQRAALVACGCSNMGEILEIEPLATGGIVEGGSLLVGETGPETVIPLDEMIHAAAFAPGTHDGPGWITTPIPTQRLRDYWAHGEGAAKIRWGVAGDFNRCRKQLAKYIANPEWLAGTCANLHYAALGFWPAQHRAKSAHGSVTVSLTAAASTRTLYPSMAFAEPADPRAFPMRIDRETRIISGYAAQWGVCHIGIEGMCKEAPHSRSDYSFFRKGVVQTDAGEQNVALITYGIGHASERARAAAATAHYDQPDAVRAYINIGENAYGIWYSGVLAPWVTDEDIDAMMAIRRVSGDWRNWSGRPHDLEMVGLVVVNTEGFQLAASGGIQTAAIGIGALDVTEELVASGTVRMDADAVAAISRMAVAEYRHQEKVSAAIEPARSKVRERRLLAARARTTKGI